VPPGERYTYVVRHGDIAYYVFAPGIGLLDIVNAFILGCTHDQSPPGRLDVRTICERDGSTNSFCFHPMRCLHWPQEREEVPMDD
jgi:hypothetical protein